MHVCVERVITQRPFIHTHVAAAGQLSHPALTEWNPTVLTLTWALTHTQTRTHTHKLSFHYYHTFSHINTRSLSLSLWWDFSTPWQQPTTSQLLRSHEPIARLPSSITDLWESSVRCSFYMSSFHHCSRWDYGAAAALCASLFRRWSAASEGKQSFSLTQRLDTNNISPNSINCSSLFIIFVSPEYPELLL